MRCPNCKNRLLQKSDAGVRLRVGGQIWLEESGCRAQCYWCKSEVTLPLRLEGQLEDAPRTPPMRLVLKTDR